MKIKSLAAEATIIRQEERRAAGMQRNSLHNHRVIEVRREARASLLAYAYLRDRPYATIERPGSRPVNIKDVHRNARRFGGLIGRLLIPETAIEAWITAESQPRDLHATAGVCQQ